MLAEVDGHLLHGGEDDEHIGVQQLRQLGGGEILVDDGGRAYQTAVAAHHGDTAAAYGDDHGAAVHQRPDGILLDDIHGLGGGDHLTPATTGVLHHGAATLGHDAVGGHLVIEGADGLGGVLEGRVVFIHQHLRDYGGHVLPEATGGQLIADGILQMVTDIALTHGATLREGHIRLDGAGLGGGREPQIDHAHLRAVAVGNDDLVAGGDEVHDGLSGQGHQLQLLGGGIAQGVAA